MLKIENEIDRAERDEVTRYRGGLRPNRDM
jgi:hypothetical protein